MHRGQASFVVHLSFLAADTLTRSGQTELGSLFYSTQSQADTSPGHISILPRTETLSNLYSIFAFPGRFFLC